MVTSPSGRRLWYVRTNSIIHRCATNEPRATSGSPDFASKSQSKGSFVAQTSIKYLDGLEQGRADEAALEGKKYSYILQK